MYYFYIVLVYHMCDVLLYHLYNVLVYHLLNILLYTLCNILLQIRGRAIWKECSNMKYYFVNQSFCCQNGFNCS